VDGSGVDVTGRSELRRMPERGSAEWAKINAVLDAGFMGHVGFSVGGQPFVIPMLYGRAERTLFLHGSAASRIMGELAGGIAACVTVTLIDGLVLARSAFHHSMNYRSVVAFGTARAIEEPRRKIEALKAISEHLLPGRWAQARGPNKKELAETAVLELAIEEATAKARSGPPADDEVDYPWPVWAGVAPMNLAVGAPIPDPTLIPAREVPDYIRHIAERFSR
jgi:uncharacterized protein